MMSFPFLIHNSSGIIIITISKITNTTTTITSIGILTTTAAIVNYDYDRDDYDHPHDHDDHDHPHDHDDPYDHDDPHDHDDHDHLPRLLPSSQNGSDPSHLPCGGRVTHSPPAQSTYKHTNDNCDCEDKYKHIETQTIMSKKSPSHVPADFKNR